MDTQQILNILRNDHCLRQIENGVFPVDLLPRKVERLPLAYVINLDKHNEPGSHWVAIFVNKQRVCEFFDSYGNHPNYIPILYKFIEDNCISLKYNLTRVQGYFTAVCGQFCLYFLLWRIRGVHMQQIISSLHFQYADEFVTGFINALFNVNTTVVDVDFIINQICNKQSIL